MKQLLSISFSFLLAVTMSGWSSYIHTCGGVIQSISLFQQESCKMEKMESCHLLQNKMNHCCETSIEEIPDSCCGISAEEDGCCQDIHIFVQYENPTFFSPTKSLSNNVVAISPTFQLDNILDTSHRTVSYSNNSRPPPDLVPLYIQFQRLIFYA